MNELDPSLKDEVELARFGAGELVEDCIAVLKQAGVPYRLSTDAAAFDYSAIGSGGAGARGSMLVMVAGADEIRACRALLAAARETVAGGVAEDFYLRDYSDEELAEVVKLPREWSAYDVAAAEVLLRERSLPVPEPSYELTEQDQEERQEKVETIAKGKYILLVALLIVIWRLLRMVLSGT